MDDIAGSVAELLSLLLGERVPVGGDIRMESCPAWDSIKHIEIIITVEEQFAVCFKPEDIPLLTSQALIVSTLQELLHA